MLPLGDFPSATQKRGAESEPTRASSCKRPRVESLPPPPQDAATSSRDQRHADITAELKGERLAPHVEAAMAAFCSEVSPTFWAKMAKTPLLYWHKEALAICAKVPFLSFL